LKVACLIIAAAVLSGCASTSAPERNGPADAPTPLARGLDPATDADPFPSTYRPIAAAPVAIVGATC
jgi:hypothetical protein